MIERSSLHECVASNIIEFLFEKNEIALFYRGDIYHIVKTLPLYAAERFLWSSVLLMMASLFFIDVCFGQNRSVPPSQAQWTFAFYLAGENSLEHEQARNLREIIKGAASLKQTHVVVFFDRDERFEQDNPITSWKGTRVFHVVEPINLVLGSPVTSQLPPAVDANRFEQLVLEHLTDFRDRRRILTAYRREGGLYKLRDISDRTRDDLLQLLLEKTDYLLPIRGQGRINLVAADEKTQRQFICFIADNFPARRYALFLAGHGNGWFGDDLGPSSVIGAAGPDEYRRNLKGTSLAEAAKWHHFDLIAMDSCLMADVETLWTLKDAADFLVLNQMQTPSRGLDYTMLLEAVGRSDQITPRQLALEVVDSYARAFGKTRYPISTAAFEATRIEPMARQWNRHFEAVQNFRRLDDVRQCVPNISTATILRDAMVDMPRLCNALGMKEMEGRIEGPDGVMIGRFQQHTGYGGLSVYLPKDKATFSRTITAYRLTPWAMDFPSGWVRTVEHLYAIKAQGPRGTEDDPRP